MLVSFDKDDLSKIYTVNEEPEARLRFSDIIFVTIHTLLSVRYYSYEKYICASAKAVATNYTLS